MKKEGSAPDGVNAARRALEKTMDGLAEGIQQKQDDSAPPTTLNPGDTVKILTIGSNGTVVSAPNSKGEVEVQAGIMKMKVALKNLRLVQKKPAEVKAAKSKQGNVSMQTEGLSRTVKMECDVRGMMLEDALIEVDGFINNAIMGGLAEISIIHGKGTGVLRAGIQQHLKRHKGVASMRLGVYGEGETGVTIVKLK